MRRLAMIPLLAVIALAGCATPASTPTPTPTTLPSFSFIEDFFEELGCEGRTEDGAPPAILQGSCRIADEADLAFFWQFESPSAAGDWIDSDLELGPDDTVYQVARFVIVASDPVSKERIEAFAARAR